MHSIGECIKIHGSLSQDMIMGVNDNTQIYNEDLKNNRKIKNIDPSSIVTVYDYKEI